VPTAYHEILQRNYEAQRAAAQARRISQVPERKLAKLKPGVAGSGSTPAAHVRPKSAEEMTAEEADAALVRQYGTHPRSGRLR
jgi:hypothetical protein